MSDCNCNDSHGLKLDNKKGASNSIIQEFQRQSPAPHPKLLRSHHDSSGLKYGSQFVLLLHLSSRVVSMMTTWQILSRQLKQTRFAGEGQTKNARKTKLLN